MSQRARPLALVIALCSLVMAGCIGDESPAGETTLATPTVLEDALAALEAGNHSANIEQLGHFGDGGAQEMDAWGDFLAVMQNPKLRILNISDPLDITLVGEITLPAVKDVKWSHDGEFIFVGDDGGQAATANYAQGKSGFYVIDVSDKSEPKLESQLPVGPRRGPHMVFYHLMPDGREIVLGANADISINEFDRATGTLKELARYSPDVITDWNRDPHVFDVYYQGFAHDMFVMDDPVDNKTLMYVANWDAGLRVVDISDPAKPTELGKWDDYPQDHSGNLHTVSTMWIGDQRITVGSPELGFSVVGGYHYAQGTELTGVYVWDTTDPANIELLTYWNHPIESCKHTGRDLPVGDEKITSSHNLQLEEARVYLAHYACGTVILDVAEPATPKLVAFDMEGVTSTWDILLHRGVTYYGDSVGVLARHFALDVLGEDGISSRA